MLAFVSSAPNSHYLYSPLATLLVPMVLYLLNGTIFPTYVILIPVFLQVYNWVYLSIPPSVLYLSQARPESILFRETLEREVNPYRVLALFTPSLAGKTLASSFRRNLFDWDNLWTTSDTDWKPKVFRLITMAPVIVVDTRYPSHATKEEIAHIEKTRCLDKVLFIVTEDEMPTGVETSNYVRKSAWNVVTADELPRRLQKHGIIEVCPPPKFHVRS